MSSETGFASPGMPNALGHDAAIDDEALAAAARAGYLTDGLASIEPDPAVRSALGPHERLLALRDIASIVDIPEGGRPSVSGRLAITTERLVMVNEPPLTVATLEELADVSLVTDRLLVMLTSGASFTIQAHQPRLLRVQLAEARASRLDRQMLTLSGEPTEDLPRL